LKSEEEIFDLTHEVKEYLETNRNIKKQFDKLVNILIKNLSKYDITFPKIRVKLEENFVSVHWVVGKGYFAANIVEDESESSWTLIELGKTVRGYEADGYLNDNDLEMYISIVIRFMGKFVI